MTDDLKEMLYRSFDQSLTEIEQQTLDGALKSDPKLQELKHQLESMRETLGQMKAVKFSDSFTGRVFNSLDSNTVDIFNSYLVTFKRMAIAAAFLIVSSIAINWVNSGELNLTLNEPEQTIEEEIESSLADLF